MAKLYIFDFDGTLANTMELWDQMTCRFLSSYGIDLDGETLEFLNTLHYERCLDYFVEELSVPVPREKIGGVWHDFAVEVFKAEARALPGAVQCLDRLRAGGAKLALFTLSPRSLVEMLMELLGLEGKLDRLFMGGETVHPKSDPKSFLEIAEIMGEEPRDTVVVEDSPYACASAKLAGMTTCGICISNKHSEALLDMCDFVIYNYSELN